MNTDDETLDELLGAYALDAVDADEARAVEDYLARAPHAAEELALLRNAAAWIGATEALALPPGLRDSILGATRAHRHGSGRDEALGTYLAETGRFDTLVETLTDETLDRPTFNRLTVRELVIHLASMESSLAAALGAPTAPEVVEDDIEARTVAMIERFRHRPLGEAWELWQASVEAVHRWAIDPAHAGAAVRWVGLPFTRDSVLVARAFEHWTHADDIRRALDRRAEPPAPDVIHRMADLSLTTLPVALEATHRAHRDKTAGVVLTGPGGGTWTIPMGLGEASAEPDVVLSADVVDWCLVAGERLEPSHLTRTVRGDVTLADDLVAAAPAFASL